MRKLIYILFIVISYPLFAQSGQVVYAVKMDSTSYQDSGQYFERLKKMKEYANDQKFVLKFNKNQSSFKIIERMSKDERFDESENRIAQLAMTAAFDIYVDKESRKEIQVRTNNQLIEFSCDRFTWEIATESKVISNYLCYKAILKIPFVNRFGENKIKEVIAWFAPSLPYSYGPTSYYGLPGLIIELHEKFTTYLATKIDLSKENIRIEFPKGKTITEEEYIKKLKAQMGM